MNKQLLEIGAEMRTQNNRGTHLPLFVVMEDVKVYGEQSWCNEVERRSEYDRELLCEKCAVLAEGNDTLPDYCEDCDSDLYVWFNWEERESVKAGVFFTARACDEHIRLNGYHYCKPRSYAISAWRNPEMEAVMDFLKGLK